MITGRGRSILTTIDEATASRVRPIRVLASPAGAEQESNPYVRLLVRSMGSEVVIQGFSWPQALLGRHDVIHVHWPDSLLQDPKRHRRALKRLAMATFLVSTSLRSRKLVWTVHNARPHERPSAWDRGLLRWFAARTSARIFLTSSSRETYTGSGRRVVIPHGPYDRDHEAHVAARSNDVGESAPVLLFFGQLRPYKGVEQLISAFAEIKQPARLVIVGHPRDAMYARKLAALAAATPHVETAIRHVDDLELASRLSSARGVVLPYQDMGNSGAMLLALSWSRPVLVPWSPTTTELAQEIGLNWVRTYEGQLTSEHLAEFLVSTSRLTSSAPDLSARDWRDIGAQHIALYRSLTSADH